MRWVAALISIGNVIGDKPRREIGYGRPYALDRDEEPHLRRRQVHRDRDRRRDQPDGARRTVVGEVAEGEWQ